MINFAKLSVYLFVFILLFAFHSESSTKLYKSYYPNKCIGGDKCGGVYEINLQKSQKISYVKVFAHDNIGDSKSAVLILKLDGQTIGKKDVKSDGSMLTFEVNSFGKHLVFESRHSDYKGSDETFIQEINIYTDMASKQSKADSGESGLIKTLDINKCIGGRKCGGNYQIDLKSSRYIYRIEVFAHDNVGDSSNADLVCFVDGREVGRHDVKKAGSNLVFIVKNSGRIISFQSFSNDNSPGGEESIIGPINIYGERQD